jgi:hypothetical protein
MEFIMRFYIKDYWSESVDVGMTILAYVVGAFVLFMIFAIFHVITVEAPERAAQHVRCVERGGVMLHRTWGSGKSQGSAYTCVKKDVIIEVE